MLWNWCLRELLSSTLGSSECSLSAVAKTWRLLWGWSLLNTLFSLSLSGFLPDRRPDEEKSGSTKNLGPWFLSGRVSFWTRSITRPPQSIPPGNSAWHTGPSCFWPQLSPIPPQWAQTASWTVHSKNLFSCEGTHLCEDLLPVCNWMPTQHLLEPGAPLQFPSCSVTSFSDTASSMVQVCSKTEIQGFPGGSVVKNPPANAGDTGSVPGPGGSYMPQSNQAHVPQLLSLCSRVSALQQEKPPKWEAWAPQLEKSLPEATKT